MAKNEKVTKFANIKRICHVMNLDKSFFNFEHQSLEEALSDDPVAAAKFVI